MQMKYTILSISTAAIFGLSSCETAEDPVLSGSDISVEETEGTQSLDYEVSLNAPAPKDVMFDYQAVELTALEGEDFAATSGTATIAKGETKTTLSIPILGDEENEQSEDFWISYSNGQNVSIPDPFNVITIEDNDAFIPSDSGYTTPDNYPGFTLVWSDEFNGTALNTNDWSYETGASGWGNQESQYYRPGTNNATVSNGYLTITAKQEGFSGAPFTSARIITQNAQSFKFGRIDIRARLPYGKGIWPALWMLGDNFATEGWPSCGEIDIMELVGGDGSNDRTVHGTAHWDNNGQHASHSGSTSLPVGQKYADEFHVYTITWEQGNIKWYVDDVLYHQLNTSSMPAFQEKFFFIFNIAVEGSWPGPIDANTTFPQYMTVDYVRVFQ